jgi:NADH:ubiquinone oxidoreductase subunit 2 (subunit N)
MEKIKKFLKWATLTKMGRVITSLILAILFYYLAYKTDDFQKETATLVLLYISGIFAVIFGFHMLAWFAYAWVINPIRDYCKYKGRDTRFCKFFCKK